MQKIHHKIILTLVFVFAAFWSCKQGFLDKVNPNQLSVDSFFKTEDDALASVNSAYGASQRLELWGRKYFFLFDLLSDDIKGNDPLFADGQTLAAYSFNAGSETVTDIYKGCYRGIERANYTIANLNTLKDSTTAKVLRIKGEAKFLRSLYYFDLVANYGAVPLRTKVNGSANDLTPMDRTPANQVWAFIEKDLTDAEGLLPDSYDGADLGRATKWSAKALLGKAYLYQKKYPQAAAKFKEIIDYSVANPTKLGLMKNYRDNFVEVSDADGSYVEFNKESLFEISFAGADRTGGFNTWGQDGSNAPGEGTFRAIEYGFTIFGNTSPSLDIVNAYPDTDPRKRMNMFGPGSTYYPGKVATPYSRSDWQHKKYSNLGSANGTGDDVQNYQGSSINMRVIRYADVLLMYAEALNAPASGNGTAFDPAAVLAIDQVRARVSLPGCGASDPSSLFSAIVNERRYELWCEQVRRKDLVRWGIAKTVLGSKFVVGKHELLPIPQTELDLTSGMKQNPGY